ncbi:hypothetical protein [Salmonella enterica]|uniref:hypothetical protein n=1 Tax=Salmonella enterica TaxID=28901 RepID=UPI001D5182CD|nr:hypothetical protein [Salmonella enterica]EHQ8870528.1 hypothetical protein [Salmonella enterica]EHZ0238452.1 hypothetical protein [Salmonella enterica]EIB1970374.1 hypothetical protein [Salmonella enterica]
MPLTLNSFIQAKPDHVPVKVFLFPVQVVSLTRGKDYCERQENYRDSGTGNL